MSWYDDNDVVEENDDDDDKGEEGEEQLTEIKYGSMSSSVSNINFMLTVLVKYKELNGRRARARARAPSSRS